MRKHDVKQKFEIRGNVKFCQHIEATPSSTFETIKLTKGKNSVSRSLVLRWNERLMDVEDEIIEKDGR